MKRYYLPILILFLFSFAFTAYAQIDTGGGSQVDVEMIPQNPGPNEEVTVKLTSYGADLDNSTITWRMDGTTKLSGTGVKSFTFRTGQSGTSNTLGVTVRTRTGEVISQQIVIRPVSVDLIWQAESYVPPFYKGKALYAAQDKITFIAIPHMISGGREVNAKNLVYKWMNNGSVIDGAGGYGKNTYTTTGSVISRPYDISVEVSSASVRGTGYSHMSLGAIDPFIVFYEKNPLYGIRFQNAIQGTLSLSDTEVVVVGLPFFFGATSPFSSNLSYRWTINGSKIADSQMPTTQIFRQKEGTTGTSKIGLSIEDSSKVLQASSKSFNLSFGNVPNTQSSF